MSQDEDEKKAVLSLVTAIQRYGTIHHHHYRPIKDCFLAAFNYATGAIRYYVASTPAPQLAGAAE